MKKTIPEIKHDEKPQVVINPVEEVASNVIIPVIDPNATAPGTTADKPKKRRSGKASMITSIACFVVGLAFLGLTMLFFFKISGSADASNNPIGIIAALIFVFTFGFISYLPAFGFAIAGLIAGIHGTAVSEKGIRITNIISLILNILLLAALVGTFILFTLPMSA